MHIIPAVRRLEEKYATELVVIGVHAGKFTTERVTENIRTATRRLDVEHPVVNDRQFRTWRSYNVSAWPTLVLVSPDGKYLGEHAGEITFESFDRVLEAVVKMYDERGLLERAPLHFPLDPTPPSDYPLHFPGKVLADPAGRRLFIADTGHNRVLVASVSEDQASAQITQVIGSGEAGLRDGDFSGATLKHPEGMALLGGTLYIADKDNHAIRAADLASGKLTTIAGTGEQGHRGSGGIGTAARLNSPWDLLERDGILYIAMAGTHQIWWMNPRSRSIGPLVGSGRENIDDGPNAGATLAQPSGLATDGKRLFFADSESSAVRAADFTPQGYTQTLVGEGLFEFGDRDGGSLQARLQHCLGVTYHNGRIYIADTYNNKIKSLDLATKEVTTLLGSGNSSDLYEPGGISLWLDAQGARLYIADTNNHRVVVSAIDEAGKLPPPELLSLR